MSPVDGRRGFDGGDGLGNEQATPQFSDRAPVTIHSCGRLGMQASPPPRSFGWFRRR